jgi:enterochelin esterase-like enzyme
VRWFFVFLCAVLGSQAAQARVENIVAFPSRYVEARNISIWVPDDYDRTVDRLPVIYMHDGQNIFEPGRAYGGQEWGVDEALAGKKARVIVVGAWNTKYRGREYLPAKVVAQLDKSSRQRVEAVHGGRSMADSYLKFLVQELKPYIDSNYRTRTDARNTSIMGSSMGGLISIYALGEYPQTFGNAAALSVHWPLADPSKASSDEPAIVAAAFDKWLRKSELRLGPNRLYMDHGTINLDGFYRPYSLKIDAMLAAKGWKEGANWQSEIYQGTDHNEAAWRARIDIPLTFLLSPPE